jgi:hypothetical protein
MPIARTNFCRESWRVRFWYKRWCFWGDTANSCTKMIIFAQHVCMRARQLCKSMHNRPERERLAGISGVAIDAWVCPTPEFAFRKF